MNKRITTALSLLVLLVGAVLLPLGSIVGATQDNGLKIMICHRANAVDNPYQNIQVNQNSTDGSGGNGDHFDEHKGPLAYSETVAQNLKDDHIEWGDIIPPIAGTDAAAGLNWTHLGQAMWDNDCTYVTMVDEVQAVTFVNPTCDVDGSYTIPSTEGVTYYINDDPVSAGSYPVTSDATVTVIAKANKGYFIDDSATTSWTHEFTVPSDEDCVQGAESVVPDPVIFVDPTCDVDGSYTIPAVEGVEYKVDDVLTPAGTYPVTDDEVTINFTATALEGFEIEGVAEWSHLFTRPTDCVLGAQSVTPDAVVFTAPTCSLSGFYTIPETNGVDYMVDGKIVTSGKHVVANGTTVTVTAVAQADFELKEGATNQWTYTFTAPTDCGSGSVLGDSTTTPNSLPVTSGDTTMANLIVLTTIASVVTMIGFSIRKVATL